MRYDRKCPHCHGSLRVRIEYPAALVVVVPGDAADAAGSGAPLIDRIREQLKHAGPQGRTVRELQRRGGLRASAQEILNVLDYDLIDGGEVTTRVNVESRGRAVYVLTAFAKATQIE